MSKEIKLIFILLLLTGCSSKIYACNYIQDNNSIDIELTANNDILTSIKIRQSFYLPNSLILDETKFNEFKKQLDDSYTIENNNYLVKYKNINLKEKYSLSKTIDLLRKKRFYCE